MRRNLGLVLALAAAPTAAAQVPLEAMLSYPFVDQLVAAPAGNRIGWLTTVKGVRTVWTAAGPVFTPRKVASTGCRRRAGADQPRLYPGRQPHGVGPRRRA